MKLEIFRNRDFRLLMIGNAVSLIGSNMQQFALSLYVLAITGSATAFASMLAISVLPRLLFSPIAGVFGDWFDRKKSIIRLDLLNGLVIGVAAVVFAIAGKLSLPIIYILVIILEITEIFFGSSMAAVVPSIVDKDELVHANSVKSLVISSGTLLAPLLAAALYGSLGLQVILIINSISFIASAISEAFISIPKNHKKPKEINLKAFKTDLVEGLKIIKSNKSITSIISIGTILNFCLSPLFSVGLIYIIIEVLQCNDFQFGFFQAILSLSMITAPIIGAPILSKIKIGKLSFLSFIIVGILMVLLSIIPSHGFLSLFNHSLIPYIAILIISFLIGMIVTISNISLGTLFDKVVPLEFMGRTATVMNLAMTISIPFGQMLFGLLYDNVPVYIPMSIAGLIMLISIVFYKSSLLNIDKKLELEATAVDDIN